MELVVLGSGSPYPRAARPCSGYLLRTADASVWIDPGPGTLGGLLEEEALGDIDAIWVSHLHADHTADLLLSIYALDDGRLGSGTPIPVLAPKGLRERIAAFLGQEPRLIDRFLAFHDLDDGHRWSIGNTQLLSVAVAHGDAEAFALRAEHSGSVLAFTGDSGFTTSLVRIAADADLLLCEANHLDPSDPRSAVHLSAADAGELARVSRARQLVVTHIDADEDGPTIALAAAGIYAGPVHLALPGLRFTI